MARDERFNFVVNEEEKRLIAAVARKLDRTQSDAIRLLVRGAAEELGVAEPDRQPVTAGRGGNHDQR